MPRPKPVGKKNLPDQEQAGQEKHAGIKLPEAFGDLASGYYAAGEKLVGVRGFVGTEPEHNAFVSPMEAGVLGIDQKKICEANGVVGISQTGRGVAGFSNKWQAVYGHSDRYTGVVGESETLDGVSGISHNPDTAGVSGHNLDSEGKENPNGLAGWFGGRVWAPDFHCGGADCAEDFDIASTEKLQPGTVMVIDDDGALRESNQAYDRRVAGVISGAGDYRTGMLLGKLPQSNRKRLPLALIGKVFCRVDAAYGPVEVGDQLTTSSTRGHAMKVGDPLKAFGCVIGKALRPLQEGQALIPILVALQ
jgi:hypothetical protein